MNGPKLTDQFVSYIFGGIECTLQIFFRKKGHRRRIAAFFKIFLLNLLYRKNEAWV